MNRVGKNRLLKLADYLDTVPPKQFDMDTWKCGTTACAIGHACDIPSFRRAGLKLQKLYYEEKTGFCPTFKEFDYFDAITNFFVIQHHEAVKLFGVPYKKKTPKQVAKGIRKFVADTIKKDAKHE